MNGQATRTREIPPFHVFTKCCGPFNVPHIELVEVGRLGQWFNVPTQGWRVAQTWDERFSLLTEQGSEIQSGNEPLPHWWETNALQISHLSCILFHLIISLLFLHIISLLFQKPNVCKPALHVFIMLNITWFGLGSHSSQLCVKNPCFINSKGWWSAAGWIR